MVMKARPAAYVDGPYLTREEAWRHACEYAEMLSRKGLTPQYGVTVGIVPGHGPATWAVWLVKDEPVPAKVKRRAHAV